MIRQQEGIEGMMIDLDKNRRFRRLIIAWAMVLVTVFLVWSWINPPNIPSGTATVLGLIIGMIATVFGFYQWHRAADERRQADD